jgi:hypothetical protein
MDVSTIILSNKRKRIIDIILETKQYLKNVCLMVGKAFTPDFKQIHIDLILGYTSFLIYITICF